MTRGNCYKDTFSQIDKLFVPCPYSVPLCPCQVYHQWLTQYTADRHPVTNNTGINLVSIKFRDIFGQVYQTVGFKFKKFLLLQAGRSVFDS
jgi:hypothetical protein